MFHPIAKIQNFHGIWNLKSQIAWSFLFLPWSSERTDYISTPDPMRKGWQLPWDPRGLMRMHQLLHFIKAPQAAWQGSMLEGIDIHWIITYNHLGVYN